MNTYLIHYVETEGEAERVVMITAPTATSARVAADECQPPDFDLMGIYSLSHVFGRDALPLETELSTQ